MRIDRANRSFLALVSAGWLLGGYAICAAAAGVLVRTVLAYVAREGPGALVNVSLAPTLMMLAVVAAGALRAAHALARQAAASRRVARHTRALAVDHPSRLVEAARAAGLAGRVALVDDPELFSLVHGALRPWVVVSRALLDRLTDAELRAVLEHERYHVANLDPLKNVAAAVLRARLFLGPRRREPMTPARILKRASGCPADGG